MVLNYLISTDLYVCWGKVIRHRTYTVIKLGGDIIPKLDRRLFSLINYDNSVVRNITRFKPD